MKSIDRHRILLRAAVLAGLLLGSATAIAQKEVVIHADKPFPESITSTADGTLYIGSVSRNMIFRALPGASAAEPWAGPESAGIILGVLADASSGTLWACHNGPFGKSGAPEGTPQLLAFDLKTGKTKGTYPFTGGSGLCNDIAVAPDGAVYATDTFDGRILRLKKGAPALEIWAKDDRLMQADGIVVEGANVYINTFETGHMFRVVKKADGTSGEVHEIEPSSKLDHPDALKSLGGGRFLMIEGAGRLDRVTIAADKANVEVLKDGYDGPTGVTIVGGTAWVLEGKLKYMGGPDAAKDPGAFKVYPVSLH